MAPDVEPIDVTIIFPVHNEEESLVALAERTIAVMEQYPSASSWEIIIVDDASTDGSLSVMIGLSENFPGYVRVARHTKQSGQKGCFMTGFAKARGWLSVVMDADLHVLPEELPRVLDKAILEGFEMVCTHSDRSRASDRRTFVSSTGNLFMKFIFSSPVRDAANKFTAVQTHYIRGVNLINGDQRYLLPICMRRGITKISDVGCLFGQRVYGRSKYNKWKKMLIGIPQMIALKIRLLSGYYDEPPVEAGRLVYK